MLELRPVPGGRYGGFDPEKIRSPPVREDDGDRAFGDFQFDTAGLRPDGNRRPREGCTERAHREH